MMLEVTAKRKAADMLTNILQFWIVWPSTRKTKAGESLLRWCRAE
jgi:hypothetical protein